MHVDINDVVKMCRHGVRSSNSTEISMSKMIIDLIKFDLITPSGFLQQGVHSLDIENKIDLVHN